VRIRLRLEDALGPCFNGPRPPGLRPTTKGVGLSSAGMGGVERTRHCALVERHCAFDSSEYNVRNYPHCNALPSIPGGSIDRDVDFWRRVGKTISTDLLVRRAVLVCPPQKIHDRDRSSPIG
jgi:hypothetical protein